MLKANPLMTFGQAIELAKHGIAVSAQGWDLVDRITGIHETKRVDTDQIWSPENRRVGTLLGSPDAKTPVKPYFTKMTRQGIENYIPTNADMFDFWMRSESYLRCKSISIDMDGSEEGLNLSFGLISAEDHANSELPFWDLYANNLIGFHNRVYFIAGSKAPNILNAAVFNALCQHANNRMSTESFDGFVLTPEFYQDGWLGYCDIDTAHYQMMELTPSWFDVDSQITDLSNPVTIIVDEESLTGMDLIIGDNALDFVCNQLIQLSEENPNVNWVVLNLKNQIELSAAANGDSEQ